MSRKHTQAGVESGNTPNMNQPMSNDFANQPSWERYAPQRKSTDAFVKIEADGDAITSSLTEDYEEYSPLLDLGNLFEVSRQSNPNAAGNRVEAGRVVLYDTIIEIPKDVGIIDAVNSLYQASPLTIEIKRFGHIGGEVKKEIESYLYEEAFLQSIKYGIDSVRLSFNANRVELTYTAYDQEGGEVGSGTTGIDLTNNVITA